MKLNFPGKRDLEFQQIEGDAFQKLRALKLKNSKFDLVILDPPAFTRKKKDKVKALEAYSRLTTLGVELVKSGGRLFSASCSAHVSLKEEHLFSCCSGGYGRGGEGWGVFPPPPLPPSAHPPPISSPKK